MPTEKVKAVGIWGVVAMIAMGASAQIPNFPIDWTVSFMQMPLGGLVVLGASALGGWFKAEK